MYYAEAIRNMTDEGTILSAADGRGYSFALDAEELGGFTYLGREDTGLPYEIYVDGGGCYKEYGHAICLYVVSLKNSHSIVPITVSDSPTVIGSEMTDYSSVKSFIERNILALMRYADMEISSPEFYSMIDESADLASEK